MAVFNNKNVFLKIGNFYYCFDFSEIFLFWRIAMQLAT